MGAATTGRAGSLALRRCLSGYECAACRARALL